MRVTILVVAAVHGHVAAALCLGAAMSAIFNLESLILVLLLAFCTASFLKTQPVIGPMMERNKTGCAFYGEFKMPLELSGIL